jgi:hypothetical protein
MAVEVNVSITAAAIASLRPLFRRFLDSSVDSPVSQNKFQRNLVPVKARYVTSRPTSNVTLSSPTKAIFGTKDLGRTNHAEISAIRGSWKELDYPMTSWGEVDIGRVKVVSVVEVVYEQKDRRDRITSSVLLDCDVSAKGFRGWVP